MNERIRELAEQASIPAIDGVWDYNDRNLLVKDGGEWRTAVPSEIIGTMINSEKGLEKFAALIVAECANVADENYIHRGSRTCGLAIRLHFGVEEPKGWICPKCGTDRTKAVCPQGPSASVDGRCPMIGFSE